MICKWCLCENTVHITSSFYRTRTKWRTWPLTVTIAALWRWWRESSPTFWSSTLSSLSRRTSQRKRNPRPMASWLRVGAGPRTNFHVAVLWQTSTNLRPGWGTKSAIQKSMDCLLKYVLIHPLLVLYARILHSMIYEICSMKKHTNKESHSEVYGQSLKVCLDPFPSSPIRSCRSQHDIRDND